MDPRRFTTISEQAHKSWLATSLNLPINQRVGIDLLSDSVGVEMKSRYMKWGTRYALCNRQVEDYPGLYEGRELFFAFLEYDMTSTPRRIRSNVEKHIVERIVHLLPWAWVLQFNVARPRTGPYRYADQRKFPGPDYFVEFDFVTAVIRVPKDSSLVEHLTVPF